MGDERGGLHELACPKCGENAMAEIDVVPGLAIVEGVHEDGTIEWGGGTKMDWNRQEPRHAPPRFLCLSCGDGIEYQLNVATRQLTEVREED
jgi:hypothetical protein